MMDDIDALKRKLIELRKQHRDLDDSIKDLTQGAFVDQLQVQRLKRRKLELKDRISALEDQLLPDIIA
jgi:hypothetical protein